MIFKKFKDKELSFLGMGCMRLPLTPEKEVDVDAVRKMVEEAIRNGINYFDTAWGYHGGKSESIMGEVLKAYPREKFFLADKFPGYDLGNMDKVKEIFPEQLRKCGVEYFDFYLFHNVCEANIDAYLDPKFGIMEYLKEQKKAGRIRHLGFSAHGSLETMKRFLDAYGEEMEFCQIQLNYLDWELQKAKEKIVLLNEYSLPVFVMEPLRGGKLASLDEKDAADLRTLRPDASDAEWAFRFLQSLPEVSLILSGMSSMEQLKENIATFREEKPLSPWERIAVLKAALEMTEKICLPCTACEYCLPYCPQGLDIPKIISYYNDHVFSGGGFLAPMAIRALPDEKKPDACIGCASCEGVCPQGIKISKMMRDFAKRLSKK